MGDFDSLRAEAMVQGGASMADQLIVLPVVLSLLFGAALIGWRKRVDRHPLIAIPGLAIVFLVDLALLRRVLAEGPVTMMMGAWKAPFGIAFTLDVLGALFLSMAGFVALACGIHAAGAVPATERRYGFFPFLFLTMAGVSGAFLTGDLFNLYVWFEVLLVASFGLIVLGSERAQLDGATKYGFLNLIATTLFLVATGFLYGVFGTLNMADIAIKAAEGRGGDAAMPIAVLFLAAFGMKAAAFPLGAWLPASYHTPRFVVSALFAGLLTKVGIYALIRVLVMLFPPERAMLAPALAWIAGLTMMVGAIGALAQSDMRRLLNFFVVAGIGTILTGLALPAIPLEAGPPAAAEALRTGLSGAIFYALHSIVVMTALYLAAEAMADRAGTASLHRMGGLWRQAPGLAALVLVLLLAVSGLPPFSGFWPKLTLLRATIAADMPWLAAALLVSSFLITIASARVVALALWRPAPRASEDFVSAGPESPFAMIPLGSLAAVVVLLGLWPQALAGLAAKAADGVLDPARYIGSVFPGAV